MIFVWGFVSEEMKLVVDIVRPSLTIEARVKRRARTSVQNRTQLFFGDIIIIVWRNVIVLSLITDLDVNTRRSLEWTT